MLTCDQALERISAQLDNELTDREEALLEEPPHAARLRARPATRNTESTFFMF